MIPEKSEFAEMVDDMVEYSRYDPELKSGLRWIEEQALKRNVSFYDMFFDVLYRCDDINGSREYFQDRN